MDRVTVGNKAQTFTEQTTLVGGSNDAIVDVVFDTLGIFTLVNHDYSQRFKGQAGIIIIDDASGNNALNYKGNNPANAVTPFRARFD